MTAARDQPPRDTEEGEVATSKRRRGKDAVDEDEVFVDDEALDSVDDALDDDAESDSDEDDEPVGRAGRGGTATKTKTKVDSEADEKARVRSDDRVGIFGRLIRFFREVVAELRKVIWPTRKELLTYATVVIVFVTIMLTIVASLDAAFAWTVLKVFGGAKK
jgi:preprotein translocase subunit SecE